jgi:hypothetical protein
MGNSSYLELEDVIQKIGHALETNSPFSLVRIGDGENLVLAQNSVMSIQEVLKEPWAIKANNGQKGVHLPNLSLRDLMVKSINQADVVGILPYNDTTILAPGHLKRDLTDKIFAKYNINPNYTCHACINRQIARRPEFWSLLKGKRILLIYQSVNELKGILQSEPYHLEIPLIVPFSNYNQMTATLSFIIRNKNNFDIALICCGVNAVVLAQKVAELAGKVGIDFGKASNILIKGRPN